MMRSAFSLVELSIVLVILGLLTGGILTGQSLIHAAEMRSITSELSSFQTAANSFRTKYLQLPGDMTNATSFWDPYADCNATNIVTLMPNTCNGNGNGILEEPAVARQTGDIFLFWQHLALAGLLEGTYSGVAGANSNNHSTPGTNIPSSRFTNAAWSVDYHTVGSAMRFNVMYGNMLELGALQTNMDSDAPVFTPEEAWNIDQKTDDGKPGQGKVIAYHWDDCTDASDNNDTDADYLLSNPNTLCALAFIRLW